MLQSLKKICWILLLAFGLQTSWAFSLLGPLPGYTGLPANFGDAWQVSAIGYNYPGTADLGGPKNIGEGYRRNAQVYYYACDANFLDFFGSNGVVAIDQAYTIMNNSLTNVDAYSSALTEFPLNSQSINYQASALGLVDLKSETLGLMVEQMGLADPVRFAWTLHDRYLPGSAQCPNYEYLVVQRNYDTIASPLNQLQYSSYVNGTLYTYFIYEVCPASVPDPQALAAPVQVDPTANSFTAVAGHIDLAFVILNGNFVPAGLQDGGYYVNLTRDDVAGLRYLLSTNNYNVEFPAAGSVLVNSTVSGGTTLGSPFLLYSSNYTAFAQAALTNDPITLSNLYPGLVITSSSNYFPIVYTTNYYAYFTNLTGAAGGSQTLVTGQTVTFTVATYYVDTFANLVLFTNHYSTNSGATLLTVQVQKPNGAPGNTLVTNTSSQAVTLVGVPSGDYYINTNNCGPNQIDSIITNYVVATTNLLLVTSNSAGLYYSQSLITYATNYIYIAQPILCGAAASGGSTTNASGLYQGVNNVQFIKTSYDSLVGQFYQPLTNTYSMVKVVNSKLVNQTFQRVVTAPDFLFTAADLAGGPADLPVTPVYARSINFNPGTILPNLSGPGTIDPGTVITFDKVGDIYLNSAGGNFLTGVSPLAYGSFDGTTNAPVVYPDGASLANLANEILIQVSPSTLPAGTNGMVYPATTFVATGGAFSPPFKWSLPSGGLPAGLTLSSGGTISGTPTQSGTFDFTLQLTDALSRSVQWTYALTIQ